MWNWLIDNGSALSALGSIGMLFIWAFYLQLFYLDHRRARQPCIVITRSGSPDESARCLVANMSDRTIFVRSIVLCLETHQGTREYPVTDIERIDSDPSPTGFPLLSRQGPIKPGDMRDLGSFESMVEHVANHQAEDDPAINPGDWSGLTGMTIYVLAIFLPNQLLIGARRSFDLTSKDGRLVLKERTLEATQITSRKDRRRLEDLLRDDL